MQRPWRKILTGSMRTFPGHGSTGWGDTVVPLYPREIGSGMPHRYQNLWLLKSAT